MNRKKNSILNLIRHMHTLKTNKDPLETNLKLFQLTTNAHTKRVRHERNIASRQTRNNSSSVNKQ